MMIEKAQRFMSDLKYSKWRTENIFLCLFVGLGLFCMVALPPFRVSDEYRHFVRAFEVSEGGLISRGTVPENIDLGLRGKMRHGRLGKLKK